MSRVASPIDGKIWAPPTPTAGQTKHRWQRLTSIAIVAALHVVLLAMCAIKPWDLGGGGPSDAKNVVYVTSELTMPEPMPILQPAAATETRGRDLRQPRLIESSAPDAAEFARRAGVAPGKSARVMLAVKVTELGVASRIRVATSSGNTDVDALAIEYARALRWNPAVVEGRPSSTNIRLPVVLARPD